MSLTPKNAKTATPGSERLIWPELAGFIISYFFSTRQTAHAVRRTGLVLAALLLAGRAPAQTRPSTANPDSLRVVWTDVDQFWHAFDRLQSATNTPDSLAVIEQHYLAVGTPGLRRYAKESNSTATDFLQAIRAHRRYLAAIRPATQSIGQHQASIIKAARQLKKLYPPSTFTDLYFVMGKFQVGGTQFDNLLYIGAELKCSDPQAPLDELNPMVRGGVTPASELTTVSIHEMVHAQQPPGRVGTNLELALREGAAEYVAYRLTKRLGSPTALNYGCQHEATVRQQFAADAQQAPLPKWFLATPDPATQAPGALGYFIGFRICEAYYNEAKDRKAALQTIIGLTDTNALLARGRKYLGI